MIELKQSAVLDLIKPLPPLPPLLKITRKYTDAELNTIEIQSLVRFISVTQRKLFLATKNTHIKKKTTGKISTACIENMFDVLRNDRVTINVGGFRHNTFLTTLKNIPDTRLSWIAENHPNSPDFDPVLGEYFFDRHPRIFTEVLNYYRIGKLHCPADVCSALFQEELSYWGINERDIEPCCWVLYKRQMNTEETLKTFHLDNARKASGGCTSNAKGAKKRATIASLFGSETVLTRNNRERWRQFRPKVWALLDDPRSSLAAKVRM